MIGVLAVTHKLDHFVMANASGFSLETDQSHSMSQRVDTINYAIAR